MGGIKEASANAGDLVLSAVFDKDCDRDFVSSDVFERLKKSDPSEWLAAPPALVQCAKQASEELFSVTAKNFVKAPLSELYTDRFDAEQIWQQIDLQSNPVLSYIRRKLKLLEKSSSDEFFTCLDEDETKLEGNGIAQKVQEKHVGSRILGSDSENASEDGLDSEDVKNSADDLDSEEEEEEEEEEARNGVEDEFFKISAMEKFLDRTDAEGIFGTGREGHSGDDDDTEDDDDDEDDEKDFEEGMSGEDGKEDKELGFGKYDEFFGTDKKKKSKPLQERQKNPDEHNLSKDDEGTTSSQPQPTSQAEKLSTHERRQEKIEKRMRQLEKANLDPKEWTQQGEVTAKKRPLNSALEVELDFEHNVRPPPVITEEITASLEDIIRERIAEGRFDDVQRKSAALAAAPRQRIELDETRSQKGLGEIYESEYMQQTGLAVAPTSASEALKKEATELFRVLCGRLDALSHFHFAPKPVIEDMEVRADVPALTMEEVAPLAVSDASMLAPEEIFTGEDAIKGESELTPEERKRRRAQKKRKHKGEKKIQEVERVRKRFRPIGSAPEEPKPTLGLKIGHSSFSKSSKVFAELDRTKGVKGKVLPKRMKSKLRNLCMRHSLSCNRINNKSHLLVDKSP